MAGATITEEEGEGVEEEEQGEQGTLPQAGGISTSSPVAGTPTRRGTPQASPFTSHSLSAVADPHFNLRVGDNAQFVGITMSHTPIVQTALITKSERLVILDASPPRYRDYNSEVLHFDRLASCLGGIFARPQPQDRLIGNRYSTSGVGGAGSLSSSGRTPLPAGGSDEEGGSGLTTAREPHGEPPVTIGALFASFSYTDANTGDAREMSLGMPTDVIADVVNPLRATGTIPPLRSLDCEFRTIPLPKARTGLGLPPAWANRLESAGGDKRHVLCVRRCMPRSHAAAVLKEGDLILAVNGRVVVSYRDVEVAVQYTRAPSVLHALASAEQSGTAASTTTSKTAAGASTPTFKGASAAVGDSGRLRPGEGVPGALSSSSDSEPPSTDDDNDEGMRRDRTAPRSILGSSGVGKESVHAMPAEVRHGGTASPASGTGAGGGGAAGTSSAAPSTVPYSGASASDIARAFGSGGTASPSVSAAGMAGTTEPSTGEGMTEGGESEDGSRALPHLPRIDEPVDITLLRDGVEHHVNVRPSLLDGRGRGTDRLLMWAGMLLQEAHDPVEARGFIPSVGGSKAEESRPPYCSRWSYGSPAHKGGLRATNWIVEVNGHPIHSMDGLLAVVRAIGDATDVRLKCVDLQDRKRVFTLRTDTHYWPTLELRRVAQAQAGAVAMEGGGAAGTGMLPSATGKAPVREGTVVRDVGREWQLIRHSTV